MFAALCDWLFKFLIAFVIQFLEMLETFALRCGTIY